jgi:DNA polymerase I-like protein with 3'-5' exonuclease and polymerase domains
VWDLLRVVEQLLKLEYIYMEKLMHIINNVRIYSEYNIIDLYF